MNRRPAVPVLAAILAAALLFSRQVLSQDGKTNVIAWRGEQPARAAHGMVVSAHHLASDAGLEMLRAGGNAVDAAVATAFALAVVHPISGNLGGGGFLLLRTRKGKTTFIDFREKAPLSATETMYQDAKGNVIPDASLIGYRSIATPGSVAGLVYAERKYGKLGLKRVIAPAIRLARDGFQLSDEEADEMKDKTLTRFADSKRIFQRGGDFYREGETVKQPELERTLERIAVDPDDFYHGAMARELVDELRKGGALLTLQDFAQYRVVERRPVTGTFHDYTIISAPPPSSGGVALLAALNMLEGYDLKKLGDRTPEYLQLVVEAYRRSFMDRSEFLGDPDYNHIPVAGLVSKKYAAAWRSSISPGKAAPSAVLHRPEGFLPPPPQTAGHPVDTPHTTHLSVVDAEGNAVALTTTINNDYGSGVTAGSLGFLLNDEMDDFASKAGTPNYYGLIQGPADAIAPGKRPLSAMTPTIVLEEGKLRFVLGSPGGARIITTVTNIFLSAAEGGLNIQEAVDAPRFHHQYLPDKLYLEPGFPPQTIEQLRSMGYTVDVKDGHWSEGECIEVDPKSGKLLGGLDHRIHYSKAAGY